MLRLRISLAGLLAAAATPALAGGFYLQEQSPTGVGRAFAGEAAIADNAATIFFNPAGMTRLPGFQTDSGIHVLGLQAAQADRGSTRNFPGGATAPTGGGTGGNPFDQPVVVPSGYASLQLSDRLWVGVGVSTPFGLVVVYDEGWFGRYDSQKSDLKAYNFQPSAAFKVNDWLSIGGGVDIQYIAARLTSALPNLAPGAPDGRLAIRGDDISVGWNVGVLADLKFARVGAHYRSGIDHRLDGDATLSGLLGPLAARNGEVPGIAPIALPDIVRASAVVPLGKARLLGGVTWTNWSRFQRITVEDASGTAFIESDQNYRDTWSYNFGGEYDINAKFTVRAGVMYDETPTVDGFRTTRVPDGDRTWASAGLTWRATPKLAVNASYAHVFVASADVERTDPIYVGTPAETLVTTRSRGSGNVDQFATSVSYRF
ncbi:hypothetical protein IP88_07095 [alpha proteobacterium AAP81b]|nr:hypothetical protein IP88_07095 [alpha proteobacterium AAP81b]